MKLIPALLFTVSRLPNAIALLPYSAVFTDLTVAITSQIVDLLLTLFVCWFILGP